MKKFGLPQSGMVAFLCLLWGGNLIAMKIGFEGISPICSASIRFALGAFGILNGLWHRRFPLKFPESI
jgi:drug/metabolite transporter (DMT)-like permease